MNQICEECYQFLIANLFNKTAILVGAVRSAAWAGVKCMSLGRGALVQLLRKETQCATVLTFSTNLLYSSRLTLAVNLLTRHSVTVPANMALYNRTSLKFPSHSMRPNSPSKSKFVMPGGNETKHCYCQKKRAWILVLVVLPIGILNAKCWVIGTLELRPIFEKSLLTDLHLSITYSSRQWLVYWIITKRRIT